MKNIFERINKQNPNLLTTEIFGIVIRAISLPLYYKEKADSAKVTLNGNFAQANYQDKKGFITKDFFVKDGNNWLLDPYLSDPNGRSFVLSRTKRINELVTKLPPILDKNCSNDEIAKVIYEILEMQPSKMKK